MIEPTVVAALNMNYAGPRLTVHVLDDGNRAAVAEMVDRLQYQCRCAKDFSIVVLYVYCMQLS